MENKETAEEASERLCQLYEQTGFVKGAKWQQERGYSEEEVLDLLFKVGVILESSSRVSAYTEKRVKDWFENIKKK